MKKLQRFHVPAGVGLFSAVVLMAAALQLYLQIVSGGDLQSAEQRRSIWKLKTLAVVLAMNM